MHALLAAIALLPIASQQLPSFDGFVLDPICHSENALGNAALPRKYAAYDWVPVTPDQRFGFYVVYSGRNNGSCVMSGPGNNVTITIVELGLNRVLLFGAGYGTDPFPGQPCGAPLFDAEIDADVVDEVLKGCLGLKRGARIEFVTPHGHVDHVNAPFIGALRARSHVVDRIYFHVGDDVLVTTLPGWTPADLAAFTPLMGSACSLVGTGAGPLEYFAPIGKVAFVSRPGHTAGSLDLVLDVLGDPGNRYRMLGSAPSASCEPPGVVETFNAHGNVVY